MAGGVGKERRTEMTFTRMAMAGAMALALVSCGRDAASDAQEENTTIFAREDSSATLVLQPMSDEDIADFELSGDLTCRFSRDASEAPLLLASANVGAPENVPHVLVKYAEQVAEANSGQAGGFEAIATGGRFNTAALTAEVTLAEGEGRGGSQGVPLHASLRVVQPGEADAVVAGYWTCLP